MRTLIGIIGIAILSLSGVLPAQEFHPDIPKAWDDNAVKDLELPLVQRDRSPRYLTGDEYYKLRVRPIYRTYPIYVNGKEPAGYIESLKQREASAKEESTPRYRSRPTNTSSPLALARAARSMAAA